MVNPKELNGLWGDVPDTLLSYKNEGRGLKTDVSAFDIFCMTLSVLNKFRQWEVLARPSDQKFPLLSYFGPFLLNSRTFQQEVTEIRVVDM